MSGVKKYGFKDFISGAEDIEPSVSHLKRRQLAKSLQNIATHIVRMDATDEELEAYSQQVEVLEQRLANHSKIDSASMFQKIFTGQASCDELLLEHDYTILSGKASAIAFPMELLIVGDRVKGTACVPLAFQGPPQRVHGGIVATMFDILLSRTQAISGLIGFTAGLTIDYKAGTPLDTELELEAWIEKVEGRKLFNAGKIMVNGEVCATAQGLWVQPKTRPFGADNQLAVSD